MSVRYYITSLQRDAFVEELAKHSDAGRIHDQDAVLHPPKVKDPDAPMTLPEFLRESMAESQRDTDSEALLSLPEFVREPMPDPVAKTSTVARTKNKLAEPKYVRTITVLAKTIELEIFRLKFYPRIKRQQRLER
jgi:hypothetical protein